MQIGANFCIVQREITAGEISFGYAANIILHRRRHDPRLLPGNIHVLNGARWYPFAPINGGNACMK